MYALKLAVPGCVCLCGMGDVKVEDDNDLHHVDHEPQSPKDFSLSPGIGDASPTLLQSKPRVPDAKEVEADKTPKQRSERFTTARDSNIESPKLVSTPTTQDAPTEEEVAESVAPADRRRFLQACKGDEKAAEKMIGDHLVWRAVSFPLPPGAPDLGRGLPDFAQMVGNDREGNKALYLLGALYDEKLASADAYALALCALLQKSIDRTSEDMVTVMIDSRGGHGWPNPRPWSIVALVRALNRALKANFPGRFAMCIVFPVPWIAAKLWRSASPLDKDSTASIVMIEGSDRPEAPLPDRLNVYLDDSVLAAVTACRNRAAREFTRA